jgi:hypothetical protein
METNHCGENICQCASDFKHDDYDGDADVHDAAECCCGTEEGIGTGCDTRPIWFAGVEEGRVWETLMNMLNEDANHSSECGANSHGRDENTCRHLAAKGDDDEKCSYDGRDGKTSDHMPSLIAVA